MSKYCGKCGRKVNAHTGRCPKCDKKPRWFAICLLLIVVPAFCILAWYAGTRVSLVQISNTIRTSFAEAYDKTIDGITEILGTINTETVWIPETGDPFIPDNVRNKEESEITKSLYLLDVCPPYESNGYDERTLIIMGGKEYLDGFTLDEGYNDAYALFNLDGKYDMLKFDLGHVDGTSMSDATIEIYLDGEIARVIEAKAEDLPKHYEVPLNGARHMKIMHADVSLQYPEYGFVNVVLK